jgi:hypothetical protein
MDVNIWRKKNGIFKRMAGEVSGCLKSNCIRKLSQIAVKSGIKPSNQTQIGKMLIWINKMISSGKLIYVSRGSTDSCYINKKYEGELGITMDLPIQIYAKAVMVAGSKEGEQLLVFKYKGKTYGAKADLVGTWLERKYWHVKHIFQTVNDTSNVGDGNMEPMLIGADPKSVFKKRITENQGQKTQQMYEEVTFTELAARFYMRHASSEKGKFSERVKQLTEAFDEMFINGTTMRIIEDLGEMGVIEMQAMAHAISALHASVYDEQEDRLLNQMLGINKCKASRDKLIAEMNEEKTIVGNRAGRKTTFSHATKTKKNYSRKVNEGNWAIDVNGMTERVAKDMCNALAIQYEVVEKQITAGKVKYLRKPTKMGPEKHSQILITSKARDSMNTEKMINLLSRVVLEKNSYKN